MNRPRVLPMPGMAAPLARDRLQHLAVRHKDASWRIRTRDAQKTQPTKARFRVLLTEDDSGVSSVAGPWCRRHLAHLDQCVPNLGPAYVCNRVPRRCSNAWPHLDCPMT